MHYAGAIAIPASQQGGDNLLCCRGTDQDCSEVLNRSVPGKLSMRPEGLLAERE